jgi:hypothetical protein
MPKSTKILAVALTSPLLLAISGPTLAATDGSLGATSTGSTSVSVEIPSRVQITSLQDIDLGSVDPSTEAKGSTNACIYSNQPAAGGSGGGYQVTVSGSGAGNAFTVADGGNTLTYTAFWKNDTAAGDGTGVTSGAALTNQDGADTSSTSCSNTGLNAKFTVVFSQTALQAAAPGTYTGTATIVIAPT